MLNYIKNEKGSLPYVIMIMMVLMIFVPSLLMMASTNDLNDLRSGNEKKATNLAISGMQAYSSFPGTIIDKMNYFKSTSNYGMKDILIPEGGNIQYYQYVVPDSATTTDYSMRVDPTIINTANKYKVVTQAIVGDDNKNGIRDTGETFYYNKKLVTNYDPTVGGRTATPLITPLPMVGNPITGNVAEPNAWVYVRDSGGTLIGSGRFTDTTADSTISTSFSITPNRTLVANEVISVTAVADGKVESAVAKATVAAQSTTTPPDTGIVIIVDPTTGDTTQVGMDDQIISTDQIVITPAVGDYSTGGAIDLSGEEGIVISEGVSLTTTSNGSNSGLSLASSGGDIVISGTDLTGTGSSIFSEINIVAKGNVYMENTRITAERSINITAGGSIFAKNAEVDSNKGSITFTLTDSESPKVIGNIYVDNLWLNKAGTATLASGQICGTMKSTSGSLNNKIVHNACNP